MAPHRTLATVAAATQSDPGHMSRIGAVARVRYRQTTSLPVRPGRIRQVVAHRRNRSRRSRGQGRARRHPSGDRRADHHRRRSDRGHVRALRHVADHQHPAVHHSRWLRARSRRGRGQCRVPGQRPLGQSDPRRGFAGDRALVRRHRVAPGRGRIPGRGRLPGGASGWWYVGIAVDSRRPQARGRLRRDVLVPRVDRQRPHHRLRHQQRHRHLCRHAC